MLADGEGQQHVGDFLFGGLALGHDLQLGAGDAAIVAGLHQEAARHGAIGQGGRQRVGQSPSHQQAQILLGRQDAARIFVGIGRDDHFGENLGNLFRGRAVQFLIERQHATERALGVTRQRRQVRVLQGLAQRDAARVGVLDDGAGRTLRRIELRHQLIGGVGVIDVVVGQLLALQLPGAGDTRARRAIHIKGRFLVRVLAIAQGLAQQPAQRAAARRVFFAVPGQFAGKPVGHRSVIGGRARKGPLRQLAPQGEGRGAAIGLHLVQHHAIIFHIHHHRHPVMVLGGAARHGGAADINILDGGFEIGAARDGGFERIEIAHQEVYSGDAVLGHAGGMVGLVAQRQQSAMHHRVQGLDPAIHHFREVGDVRHVADGQSGVAQRLGCAAGRNQHHAQVGQPLREFEQPGLVGDRQQGTGNLPDFLVRSGHFCDSQGAEKTRRSYRFMTA